MDALQHRIGVYPGTFDPLTNGHVSLIRRGRTLFNTVIVAVAESTPKSPLFTLEERVALAREALGDDPGIRVEPFRGLLVEYAASVGATVILRGLRAVSDFEYEFQLALMNRRLSRDIQTVFLMTDYQWLYVSSTIVKGAARLGGDVRGLVPDNVVAALRARYGCTGPLDASPVAGGNADGFGSI